MVQCLLLQINDQEKESAGELFALVKTDEKADDTTNSFWLKAVEVIREKDITCYSTVED